MELRPGDLRLSLRSMNRFHVSCNACDCYLDLLEIEWFYVSLSAEEFDASTCPHVKFVIDSYGLIRDTGELL